MSNTAVINPKPCNYGCNTRIYWDTSSNSFLEVFTKNKHICKNRPNSNNNNASKSSFYSKKPYQKYNKVPSSNSIELITGSFDLVQKKYEILSDIVNEYQGKVHGSQSHVNGNIISIVVYYEIPQGKREEVKTRL